MTSARVFVGLGSNEGDAHAHLAAALEALDRDGVSLAAVARIYEAEYVGAPEGAEVRPVLNTVAEVRTSLALEDLFGRLRATEDACGRVRDGRLSRALDLDLLAYDGVVQDASRLTLPHPDSFDRGFVLAPWEEIAPLFVVPGSDRTVVEHRARLLATRPAQFDRIRPVALPALPDRGAPCTVLRDAASLARWRAGREGTVGVVMTMGALHPGHASLVQRAAAECDGVVATLFVNPLQFGPGEDLERYPRTFDDDCELLRRHGADAVYSPAPEDLFPPGFDAYVEPGSAAEGFEGAERPGHFRGVTTVVAKLWERTRPERAYFGWKDAQQLAVIRQTVRDLDLRGEIVACPTVRDAEGVALASRNRYLDDAQLEQVRHFAIALKTLVLSAAIGGQHLGEECAWARDRLAKDGFGVDYLEIVDAASMLRVERLDGPALVIGAVRLGDIRLIDNRWIAPGGPVLRPASAAAPSEAAGE